MRSVTHRCKELDCRTSGVYVHPMADLIAVEGIEFLSACCLPSPHTARFFDVGRASPENNDSTLAYDASLASAHCFLSSHGPGIGPKTKGEDG